LENSILYCTQCGAKNPPAARFCYRCGKPISAEVSATPVSNQASTVLTLACPTCGGKLQVTPEITRFACIYCGNEHIVRRGDGKTFIEPVLRELQAVRQDIDYVQQAGVEVIRQANGTVQAAQAAQNSAAYLAQRGTLMQQISLLERSLDDKKKEKTQLEKGNGYTLIGIGVGLFLSVFILYFALESTDETLALTFAMLVGLSGAACFILGIIKTIAFGHKKPKFNALNREIDAIELQLAQLRSQIH
jgi:predicted RNA-binding Zn-ribbon protein involved in translation (DUF1610 family)